MLRQVNFPHLMLHSFDVFDTVLVRLVANPHTVFLLVGQDAVRDGVCTLTPNDFKQCRIDAEISARENANGKEVSFREIYREMARQCPSIGEHSQHVEALELSWENRLLRPVNVVLEKIREARRVPGRVLYVSDMYLPSDFIAVQLRKFGLLHSADSLWVSSHSGHTKSSGMLFHEILMSEGINPNQLTHLGDNLISDVQVPRRIGIQATRFQDTQLNRYESLLEKHSEETNGFTSILAGVARFVRLSNPSGSQDYSAQRDVACGVIGPILVGYVLFILQEAKRRNLDRIYFLARDGQILLYIAKILAPITNYVGDLKYLHASRQAWRLPAIDPDDANTYSWLFDNSDYISIASFFNRIGIPRDEAQIYIDDLGLKNLDFDQNLERPEREKLFLIAQLPKFRNRIGVNAKECRNILIQYLRQEGVMDEKPYGIVDLGWHGSLQGSLETILRTENAHPPCGFYFGLSAKSLKYQLADYAAYFFDETANPRSPNRDYWVEPILETFCAATHGLTLGFISTATGVQPLLKSERNSDALVWGLENVHDFVLQFVHTVAPLLGSSSIPQSLIPTIDELLRTFWCSPTRAEAVKWGKFPYADDQTESEFREWGETLRLYDALRSIRRRSLTGAHRACWAKAGLIRSNIFVRAMIWLGITMPRTLSRFNLKHDKRPNKL